jgi:hypothetical protein
MKTKLPSDVQTIVDYYNDEWMNYDLLLRTAEERAAIDITEGYRNLTEALEDYELMKDREIIHYTAMGYEVSPAGLKWAIDLLTKEPK